MREKIYNVLNKIYGAILIVSFFAGVLPLIPFVVAVIIGGSTGEAISVFIFDKYYPWVIAASAISVFIGWIAMYIGGKVVKENKKTPKANEKDKGGKKDNTEAGNIGDVSQDDAKTSAESAETEDGLNADKNKDTI